MIELSHRVSEGWVTSPSIHTGIRRKGLIVENVSSPRNGVIGSIATSIPFTAQIARILRT